MEAKRFFFHASRYQQGAVRFVCFPYAGAGGGVFKSWESQLPDYVDLMVAELPGRGISFGDPLLCNMRDVVPQMADDFINYIDKPFVFFGHSLGALICFELCKELRTRALPEPEVLIVSGRRAPHCPTDSQYHLLSDDRLIDQLRNYEGTPDEILADADMMRLILPILRADFTVAETYRYLDTKKFDFPIAAFGGKSDKGVPKDSLLKWSEFTKESFVWEMFDGAHFYLQQRESKNLLLHRVCSILGSTLILAR